MGPDVDGIGDAKNGLASWAYGSLELDKDPAKK